MCMLYSTYPVTPLSCYLLHATSLVRFRNWSLPSSYSRAKEFYEAAWSKTPKRAAWVRETFSLWSITNMSVIDNRTFWHRQLEEITFQTVSIGAGAGDSNSRLPHFSPSVNYCIEMISTAWLLDWKSAQFGSGQTGQAKEYILREQKAPPSSSNGDAFPLSE